MNFLDVAVAGGRVAVDRVPAAGPRRRRGRAAGHPAGTPASAAPAGGGDIAAPSRCARRSAAMPILYVRDRCRPEPRRAGRRRHDSDHGARIGLELPAPRVHLFRRKRPHDRLGRSSGMSGQTSSRGRWRSRRPSPKWSSGGNVLARSGRAVFPPLFRTGLPDGRRARLGRGGAARRGGAEGRRHRDAQPCACREAPAEADGRTGRTNCATCWRPGETPVVVGSGVMNDLVKYAAFGLGIPYMCVATAASMDGYTSAGAPLSERGFKKTIRCLPARVLLADLDVIASAPPEMTGWGYGDLAGKIPAGGDWIIADALGVEPIDAVAWPMVQDGLQGWLAHPGTDRRRRPRRDRGPVRRPRPSSGWRWNCTARRARRAAPTTRSRICGKWTICISRASASATAPASPSARSPSCACSIGCCRAT